MQNRSEKYYRELVHECVRIPAEVEYIEFKLGNKDPERIAKYISGMRDKIGNTPVLSLAEVTITNNNHLSITGTAPEIDAEYRILDGPYVGKRSINGN